MRRVLASLATLVAGLALLVCVAAPALAALVALSPPAPTTAPPSAIPQSAAPPSRLPHGAVVLVRDTPHFWVADEQGILHWASGTRALVGRYVRWDQQRTVSASELERLPRGEPWLLAPIAFVRGATGDLHVVVWQSGVTWPTLLRAGSVEALRPFGIGPEHVARLATDERTWERLNGLPVDALATELMPLVRGPGQPLSGAWWTEGQWSGIGAQLSPADTYSVQLSLAEPRVDPELGVIIGSARYDSFPCSGSLGLISAVTVSGEEEVLLAERLTTGVESCTIQGRVTLTRRTDRRLFYTWSLPDRPMAVSGILLRD